MAMETYELGLYRAKSLFGRLSRASGAALPLLDTLVKPALDFGGVTLGALIIRIRIGFRDILYYSSNNEPPVSIEAPM